MFNTQHLIKGDLLKVYPEMAHKHLTISVIGSPAKDAWSLRLTGSRNVITTRLSPEVLDKCQYGQRCERFWGQVSEIISWLS